MMDGRSEERRLDWIDMFLVTLFLLGIYLGLNIRISANIPWPAAPAGVAGAILLWRRRNMISSAHLAMISIVVLVYIGAIVSAVDYNFLGKRFTGLVQLSYSLLLSYGLFLTLVQADRSQIAGILITFCLAMVVGCLLETYAGLRAISDAVRMKIYESGVYDSDIRDMLLYGRVRPKLFTSEPSAVTFCYTLFSFIWLIVSRWRWKLAGYLALLVVSLVAMPGPTLLLGLILIGPYQLFLAGRTADPQPGSGRRRRVVIALALSAIIGVIAVILGQTLFAERLHDIATGKDASFFYRIVGPMRTAFHIMKEHPWAGSGLTGEPYIANEVMGVYTNSAEFQAAWPITRIQDVLTNYVWLHWIYLGVIWGVVAFVALTLWLRVLRVPSATFCWAVWVVLGQASGAYVSPKTWTVLFLAAGASVLYLQRPAPSPRPVPVVAWGLRRGRPQASSA
jgi:hypothetical protein